MAVGGAHCEAAAGTVDALIAADVSRMASLIIMGQLVCCGMLRCLLRFQRIDRANAFADSGTCLFERHTRDALCVPQVARCSLQPKFEASLYKRRSGSLFES